MTKNELIKFHKEVFNRIPSDRYVELFIKFCDYSNTEFPITDFLLDIELNKDPNYNKEKAFDDLEKIFNLFKYYYDLAKIEEE